MNRFKYLLLTALSLLCFGASAFAQSTEQSARTAQWDSYAIPDGAYTRFVDRKNGYSFWRPADWTEASPDGRHTFMQAKDRTSILTITEDIPDGYGIASYTSSFLQQMRKQAVKQDSVTIRHVMIGGTDGREISLLFEAGPDQYVREIVWLAAVGPRAYVFILATKEDLIEQYEPYFKRSMMSVHIGSAGHWNAEFEDIRAKFPKSSELPASRDAQTALLAESIRTGKSNGSAIAEQIAQLAVKAPDAVVDLLTDYDPNVRIATMTGLAKVSDANLNSPITEVLIWALTDKDNYCSETAARALASRGQEALSALQKKLPDLAIERSAFLHGASVLSDNEATILANELVQSDDKNKALAGLEIASALPLKGLKIPYSQLLSRKDSAVVSAAAENARVRRDVTAVDELLKVLGTDSELLAIRALGEIAPPPVVPRLQEKMKGIDTGFSEEFIAPPTIGKKTPKGKNGKSTDKGGIPAPPLPPPPADGKPIVIEMSPEDQAKFERNHARAQVRGELVLAIAKIQFRDGLANAKNDAEKKKIIDKALSDYDIKSWVPSYIASGNPAEPTVINNVSRLLDAPSTGETLLPATTSLYVMSPSVDQTLSKFEAAMSGIQMETVRDQMILVRLLKLARTGLTTAFNAEASSDASAAVGIDLKSPVSIAAWPNASNSRDSDRSALILKVTDRLRFEKSLSYYLEQIGGFDSLPVAASGIVRLAGTAPSILPLAMAAVTSEEARGVVKPKAQKPLSTIVYRQQEQWGQQPVTRFEKVVVNSDQSTERETIYLTYLGSTAVIVNSRSAMLELLKTDTSTQTIKTTEAFNKAKAESGEIVFFSQLGSLFQNISRSDDGSIDKSVESFAKFIGAETGSLKITQASWETYFHLAIGEKDLGGTVRSFKPSELRIPRELMPANTILYAGAVIDPVALFKTLKDAHLLENNNPMDDKEFETTVLPHLQGEIGFGMMSFKQLIMGYGSPAMILAFELKDNQLAAQAHSQKGPLFADAVHGEAVLGSPVFRVYWPGGFKFAIVTDQQLIIADSVETLKLLEAKDRFSTSRDFTKSVAASNDPVTLFSTYSLDSAINESMESLPKDETTQTMMSVLGAFTHAFHSQRLSVTTGPNGSEGKLAVSFDREGRYSVGELAKQSGEFEVAAAIIPVKGFNIVSPTRIESLALRVAAHQSGVVTRIKEDVNKYPWQHVQSSDDLSMVFTSEARHIPSDLTIKLPVNDPTFSRYLGSTSRIRPNAPEIRNLAKQIVGNNRDGRTVAHKIGEWTYSNLKWKKVESDTVETLTTKEADCFEHSELYVALARSVGLPARVVSGAAYGGGSFGAHAWVEIYLGKWVEVDPTWGMMDYIDATHIRLEGESFASYAMLSQFEMEVVAVHNSVADYQRDPLKLMEAYESKEAKNTIETAFDLSLTARQVLGSGAFEKLDQKQRDAVNRAFDKLVADRPHGFSYSTKSNVLSKEITGDNAAFLVREIGGVYRFLLTRSDGAWYITEIEDLDHAISLFSDSLKSAAAGNRSVKQIRDGKSDRGLKQIDELIARTGETPQLLLTKAWLLRKDEIAKFASDNQTKDATKKQPSAAEWKSTMLLTEITKRWPDFAPAFYDLGVRFAFSESLKESSIEPLKRYAQLAPWDSRPLESLTEAYEGLKKLPEAEAIRKQLIERDPDKIERFGELIMFYVRQDQPNKATASFSDAAKLAANLDEVFDSVDSNIDLDEDENPDKKFLTKYEKFLVSLPKELATSQAGLRNLSRIQDELEEHEAALATMRRVIALKPESSDYVSLAKLHRDLNQFNDGLAATNEALKLNDKDADALIERACNLAQLGRKKEAMESLKKAIEINSDLLYEISDEALKPLEDLPEFKAMQDKLKAASEELRKPAL